MYQKNGDFCDSAKLFNDKIVFSGSYWDQHRVPCAHDHLDVLHAPLSRFPRREGSKGYLKKTTSGQRRLLNASLLQGLSEEAEKSLQFLRKKKDVSAELRELQVLRNTLEHVRKC
jgi:hypothetical protein